MPINNSTLERNQLSNPEEVSMKELLLKILSCYKYLLSKWLVILIFGIIGGIIGFLYANSKKIIYTASTTFVLEDDKGNGNMGGLAGIASFAGLDIGGGTGGIFQGDNIFELYKSRTMIQKTLLSSIKINGKEQSLMDKYIELNNLRDKWKDKAEILKIKFGTEDSIYYNGNTDNRLRDSILGTVINDIKNNYLTVLKPDKKLNIFLVEVKSSDEQFAKLFNDQIVKNVNDFYVQTKTKKSLDNVAILKQKVDSVRSVMSGAIFKAATVTDNTPNLNPTRQTQRMAPLQNAQFSAESNKTILTELLKNFELSKISLQKETPLIQTIDRPIYPLNMEKAGRIKYATIFGLLTGFIISLLLLIRAYFKSLFKTEQNYI